MAKLNKSDWLDQYPPDDQALQAKNDHVAAVPPANQAKAAIAAVLDLHMLTANQALSRLRQFLARSGRQNLTKLLIIYGKGLHSAGPAVLPAVIQAAVKAHPLVGRTEIAKPNRGGSGALVVYLKKAKPQPPGKLSAREK